MYMSDFANVTPSLLIGPMATELECGYIGLDIVDQLHFVEHGGPQHGVELHTVQLNTSAQYVLTGRALLAASHLLYGLVCRRGVELQIHRLEPQAPDLTSLNVP